MHANRCVGLIVICFLFPFTTDASPQPTPLMRAALDGKWAITITPDEDAHSAGEREIKDTITFKTGKFTSEAFAKRGFETGAYEEEMHPGGVGGFSVIQKNKSANEGTATWTGFISNPELRGDIVVKKKDGTVLNFSYTGSKQ